MIEKDMRDGFEKYTEKCHGQNDQILIAAREQYNENKLDKTIILHRLKNDTYAQMMPYQKGYEYIEVWMKKYYELPDDAVFEWD